MGFLDRLSGGKAKEIRQQQEAEASAAAAAAAAASAAAAAEPSTSSISSPTSVPGLLDNVPPGLSLPDGMGSSGGRLYNPYDGLSQAVGGKSQAFKLPTRPEFVFEEEAAKRRRGWAENIQFYTGLGFVAGGGTGMAIGAYKVLTTTPELAHNTLKLKANRWLNAAGSNAKPLGNACGILGLYFAVTEGVMTSQLEHQLPEPLITVLAGAASGALFRSPRGPRQAAIASGIGAVAAAGVAGWKYVYP